jgi:hypothetical protein
MLRNALRQGARSQRWQAASKQEEPLLDKVMRGDPEACTMLGGGLVVLVFVVVYRLLR